MYKRQEQPDESGVLNEGRRTCRDFAEKPAAGLDQSDRVAAHRTEDACGHCQRDQDLHGRDTGIAQAGIQAQRQALHPLRIEEADVGHGRGEVAAAEAGEESQELEYPQRCRLVLQGDAGPEGGDHQQSSCENDRVAPAGDADEEA